MVERRSSVYIHSQREESGEGDSILVHDAYIREKRNTELAEVDEVLNRRNGDLCVYFILCGSAIVGASSILNQKLI